MTELHWVGVALALAASASTYATQETPACAAGSGYTPICGMAPPEDLELSPDARFLFLSTTPGLANSQDGQSVWFSAWTGNGVFLLERLPGTGCYCFPTFCPRLKSAACARRVVRHLTVLLKSPFGRAG
ncbi:hypothetical protein PMI29_05629 [Pseudomonas sp. GM49]|uniref:hypothetical protein n=1 Tax=Pseudomonas sp. GM49 TaxID=1144331 RepID=UPI00027006EC|nr:hypothetical protein [Pseudomonas sp. GM49]EJM54487.1 hypothetical protein PMI29_05629 [Pseudomonas sp. GM49]